MIKAVSVRTICEDPNLLNLVDSIEWLLHPLAGCVMMPSVGPSGAASCIGSSCAGSENAGSQGLEGPAGARQFLLQARRVNRCGGGRKLSDLSGGVIC